MKKDTLVFSLKLLVSISILYLLLRNISLDAFVVLVSRYSLGDIITVVFLTFFALCINAYRWYILIPLIKFSTILRFTFVGQLYSFILPGQVTGEFAKAFRINSEKLFDSQKVSVSIFVDKVMAIIGLLFVTTVGLFLTHYPDLEYVKIIFLGTLLICLVLLFSGVNFLRRLIEKIGSHLQSPRLIRIYSSVLKLVNLLMEVHQKKSVLFLNFVLSIGFQMILVLITHILSQSLGLNVSFIEWLWIFGVVTCAAFLPISIAGIGVRDGIFVYFLIHTGESYDSAIALSLSILGLQCLSALCGAGVEFYVSLRRQKIKN